MMEQTETLHQLAASCEMELIEHILPFWLGLQDTRGGFYGQMTSDLTLVPDAPKGLIYHARILWAFSSAYLMFATPTYLEAATHAYHFLQHAEDATHGGVYWSMTANGQPLESTKYTYCNAFAIYGLCAYAEAAHSNEALDFAMRIFDRIEQYAAEADGNPGYLETFTADWTPLENDHLSEHDLHAAKTMNTTLHLIEAYAELYRLTEDIDVQTALRNLLRLLSEQIYHPQKHRLEVFFDAHMNVLGDLHSYGHDIEASWLIDHACDCLGDLAVTAQFRAINYQLANQVYAVAYHDGVLWNERFGQEVDHTRIWWVLAEGILGFLNAAQTAQQRREFEQSLHFVDAAQSLWNYICAHQIDRRAGGEWLAETDEDGLPHGSSDMAGIWKCPYHNSRMCLEVIRRANALR